MKKSKVKIVFSIDLEEWWGVESFKEYFNVNPIPSDDRIEKQIDLLLNYLSSKNIYCHFFVLGRLAEKYPDTIRKISQSGHEIGTHGYNHILVYNQSETEFEHDLRKSIDIIEGIINKKVTSYRAPSYSITQDSLWALPILFKNGIKYDSSIVPTKNKRFGIKHALREPYTIVFEGGEKLMELPPNTIEFGSHSLPLSSGFAFRLFPSIIVIKLFKRFFETLNIQPQIILHNWEFDMDHPRLNVPLKKRIIHYFNLSRVISKLNRIIGIGAFIRFSEVNFGKEIPFISMFKK